MCYYKIEYYSVCCQTWRGKTTNPCLRRCGFRKYIKKNKENSIDRRRLSGAPKWISAVHQPETHDANRSVSEIMEWAIVFAKPHREGKKNKKKQKIESKKEEGKKVLWTNWRKRVYLTIYLSIFGYRKSSPPHTQIAAFVYFKKTQQLLFKLSCQILL